MAYGKPSYRFSSSQLQTFSAGLVVGAAITVLTTRGGNLPPAAPAQAAPARRPRRPGQTRESSICAEASSGLALRPSSAPGRGCAVRLWPGQLLTEAPSRTSVHSFTLSDPLRRVAFSADGLLLARVQYTRHKKKRVRVLQVLSLESLDSVCKVVLAGTFEVLGLRWSSPHGIALLEKHRCCKLVSFACLAEGADLL